MQHVFPVIPASIDEKNARRDLRLFDQGRPVREHLAHSRPAGRIACDTGRAGRDQRGELLGEPLYGGAARIADADAQHHFRRVRLWNHAGHTVTRAKTFDIGFFQFHTGLLQALQDDFAAAPAFGAILPKRSKDASVGHTMNGFSDGRPLCRAFLSECPPRRRAMLQRQRSRGYAPA